MNPSSKQSETADSGTAIVLNGQVHRSTQSDRPARFRPGSWGIRAPVAIVRNVAKILLDADGGLHRTDLANRMSGRRAAAEIGLNTLGHLGFIERTGGVARLTDQGTGYARSIGTDDEGEFLARALLNDPSFLGLWTQLLSGQDKAIFRKTLVKILLRDFGYSRQTADNIASHTLGYAMVAGFCSRSGPARGYVLNRPRFRELTQGPPHSHLPDVLSESVPTRLPSRKKVPETTQLLVLSELTAWLAWALADERIFRDAHRQATMMRLSKELMQRAEATRWQELTHLAIDEAVRAFETNERELLRWSIRTLRGIADAEAAMPSGED